MAEDKFKHETQLFSVGGEDRKNTH